DVLAFAAGAVHGLFDDLEAALGLAVKIARASHAAAFGDRRGAGYHDVWPDPHRAREADHRLKFRAGGDQFALHHITFFERPQPLSADQMPRSSRKRSIGAD